ncbi:uncharacterized protein I303_105520 [Kwoniella dejecticola CBS 10117]|uniref:Mitotic spindle assembly checkpoint protein MAD2B n=1 Tax=Kwoniella dejecticola CBS 10117 TaxID=1296121 RepID=A0A1A6A299_9TREE|nr:mitotic spindle assembly checkpoint protein MAD2B [Kwoniella dejecticola CBS 10117]OBR84181.1 mitotic spindle assembly checkpoint protein MAD2B [Kwoniella dejecticola CBS 10117]
MTTTNPQPGLSYKDIADAIISFLEISLHTILYLRSVYPATTFARRRAHGVPIYQSRHPQVRAYITNVISSLAPEIHIGRLRRMTVVIKGVEDGLPRERMIFDMGYLAELERLRDGRGTEVGLIGAPNADELGLMLRGFLIKLNALDGQLLDNKGETTFAVVIETNDSLEPSTNTNDDGSVPPWIPALAGDTLHPPTSQDPEGTTSAEKHEPLLNVKAVETGVIDIRLMVQECIAKTGVDKLDP